MLKWLMDLAVFVAYRRGKQDAFREAARWAELRSDLILESAPRGRLLEGLRLAALAKDLANDYHKRSKGD